MPSYKSLLIFALLSLSLTLIYSQEEDEDSKQYDLNQGVLYKEFLDQLFEKYDPQNKEYINRQGYKELLTKMFVNDDEDVETKQLLLEVIEEFIGAYKDKISIDDINNDLKEQRLLKFMSKKFQFKSDL